MNCPKCGAEIEDGKAYCSNPACGAVLDAGDAGRSSRTDERLIKAQEALKLVEGFQPGLPVRIVMVIAAVIAVLFFIYFFVLRPSLG